MISFYLLYRYNFFDFNKITRSYHLDLLTINSIFAGFLFTNLGIMVGFVDKQGVSNLEKAGYMDNYYNSIYFGLGFHVFSAIFSAVGFTLKAVRSEEVLLLLQLGTLYGGIIFFTKSILNIFKIIRKIRNSI
ncbi:hypothetical protein [Peribacillus butanolivorans]|uniref:hypothetical protein n=1 Tax=Peribacillus butanolivorans TaxID=421767 RepID=UPI003CFFE3FB